MNLAEIHLFNAHFHHLQVRDVDSLCLVLSDHAEGATSGFSMPEIEFYRRHNTVLSAVIAETDVPGIFQAQDSDRLALQPGEWKLFRRLGDHAPVRPPAE